jgi:ABC-2 type transport system permease protein
MRFEYKRSVRKILVVASREYHAAVRTKSFFISLILLPLLMGGAGIVQQLTRDVQDLRDRRFAVVDRTPGAVVLPYLQHAVEKHNTEVTGARAGASSQPRFIIEPIEAVHDAAAIDVQRYELSERVRSGELFGFVEIGSRVLDPMAPDQVDATDDRHRARYQSNSPTYLDFRRLAETTINRAARVKRLAQLGVTEEQLDPILTAVPLVDRGLARRDARTGRIIYSAAESQWAAFLVPFALVMLMFVVIVVGATPLMQGVVEEKQQRISEVLLGSVPPFQLMLGKVLGMVSIGGTLVAVYLGAAYLAAHRFGFLEYLSPALIGWFLLFQLLSVLMFGSLFIAIGAAVTDAKELQALFTPVMVMIALPLMVLPNVLQSPSGPLAVAMSFFPPATPMLMMARLAVPPGIAAWEAALGAGVVVVTTLLLVWASGRIFRVGLLMQGKGANFLQLMRWVVRG